MIREGYSTTTAKRRIYQPDPEAFKKTQELYNEIVLFYYQLLLKEEELLSLSNQNCLRELERRSRNCFAGIPAYFRRSAINAAIGAGRSYSAHVKNAQAQQGKIPAQASSFSLSVLYYKGMYRDFTREEISLKLYDGKRWEWKSFRFKPLEIGEKERLQSPSVVIRKSVVMLHIPIKRTVADVRTIKERMEEEQVRVCGLRFSNKDSLVTCAIVDERGELVASKFIKGGARLNAIGRKTSNTVKKHRAEQKTEGRQNPLNHRRLWQRYYRVMEDAAHQTSRQIIDFCTEHGAKVIAVTRIQDEELFRKRAGVRSAIGIRKKITEYAQYKGFKEGIVMMQVNAGYTTSRCHKCQGEIIRRGTEYECRQGHRGNVLLNAAINIARAAEARYGKEGNPGEQSCGDEGSQGLN